MSEVTPPNDDAGLRGAEPITSTINARISAAERGVRLFKQGKGLRDPGGEGGPLRDVGRAKNRAALARIQQPGEAGGVSAERLNCERSDIEHRRMADCGGDSSPKTGGLVVALRLQGENELEICREDRRCLPMRHDLRQQWPKFTVFDTERQGHPIEDMREA